MKRIEELKIRNFMGLRNLHIYADPTVNEIAGPNGAGKSSALNAIETLDGAEAINPRPLRDGEGEGDVIIITDEVDVVRRFTEGKTSRMEIRQKDGEKINAPQRFLSERFSSFTFDPLAFSRMKPAEQVKAIRALAGSDYCAKADRLDDELKQAKETRRVSGAVVRSFGKLKPVEAAETVDTKAINTGLADAIASNAERDRLCQERRQIAERIETLDAELAGWQTKLDELADPPDAISTEDLQEHLHHAEHQNAQAAAYVAYKVELDRQTTAARSANDDDATVKRIEGEARKHAAGVQLPIDGVTFTTSGVRVNGLPLEQLSSSERIRMSARIGMSTNAEFRIMLIRDGSLLDADSFKEIVALAREKGYQLWIETVGTGHGDAIYLEAGEKGTPPGDEDPWGGALDAAADEVAEATVKEALAELADEEALKTQGEKIDDSPSD